MDNVHLNFWIAYRRKIGKKSRKLTRTAETYAYESYVHGTVNKLMQVFFLKDYEFYVGSVEKS